MNKMIETALNIKNNFCRPLDQVAENILRGDTYVDISKLLDIIGAANQVADYLINGSRDVQDVMWKAYVNNFFCDTEMDLNELEGIVIPKLVTDTVFWLQQVKF